MRRVARLAAVTLLLLSHLVRAEEAELSLKDIASHTAYRHPSDAMEPAIRAGEVIYVDTSNFKPDELRPGQLIAFRQKSPTPTLVVKRLIALSGSSVQFRHWKLLVDSKEVIEPYVNPDNVMTPSSFEWGPVVVQPDCVFVLSDNRDRGNDSRTFGCVAKGEIVGVVRYVAPAGTPQRARRLE